MKHPPFAAILAIALLLAAIFLAWQGWGSSPGPEPAAVPHARVRKVNFSPEGDARNRFGAKHSSASSD